MDLWLSHVFQHVQPTPGCLFCSTDASAAEILKKKKQKNKIEAKVISFLNIFSFDYESERIPSEHGCLVVNPEGFF